MINFRKIIAIVTILVLVFSLGMSNVNAITHESLSNNHERVYWNNEISTIWLPIAGTTYLVFSKVVPTQCIGKTETISFGGVKFGSGKVKIKLWACDSIYGRTSSGGITPTRNARVLDEVTIDSTTSNSKTINVVTAPFYYVTVEGKTNITNGHAFLRLH